MSNTWMPRLVLVAVLVLSGVPWIYADDTDKEDQVEDFEEESDFAISAQVDFLSRYVFRSFVYTDGPVMQPSIFTSYRNFTFGFYSNMNLTNKDQYQGWFDDYQFDFYLDLDWLGMTFEPAFTYYYYPEFTDYLSTGEVALTIYRNIGNYELSFFNSFDVLEYAGWYYGSFAVTRYFEINDRFLISGSGSIDYSQDPNDSGDSFFSGLIELTLDWSLSEKLMVRPYLAYSQFLAAEFTPDDDHIFVYGIGIAVDF
jgi:hypothetical protein